MILHGCQAKPRTPTIIEKICPQCGHEIELFSIDTQMPCEHCGFVAYNDTLSCVQWCKQARQCVGEEMYEYMLQIAAQQKERAAADRAAKKKVAEKKNLNLKMVDMRKQYFSPISWHEKDNGEERRI